MQGGATALYGPGQSLEFSASLSAANQQIGFAVTNALQPPFAVFGVKADGQLYASSVASATASMETPIAGTWFTAMHRFRFDWNPSRVDYWIDGSLVASYAVSYPVVRERADEWLRTGVMLTA